MMSIVSESKKTNNSDFLKRGCFAKLAGWDRPVEIMTVYNYGSNPSISVRGFGGDDVPEHLKKYVKVPQPPLTTYWADEVPISLVEATGPTKESIMGAAPIMPSEALAELRYSAATIGHVARRYLDAGLHILPIDRASLGRPSKCPPAFVGSWSKWRDRQVNEKEIELFWGNAKHYGIGIITGLKGLEVIDIEAESAFVEYESLVRRELPGLWERLTIHRTPKDGAHILYYCPVVDVGRKLAMYDGGERTEKGDVVWKTLIETRGEKNQVLAPGCPPDCHPSNKEYRLVQGSPETIPTVTEEERSKLLEIARRHNQCPSIDRINERARIYDGEYEDDPATPWGDYNLRGPSFESLLEPEGWQLRSGDWEHGELTRPGKLASAGCSATIGYQGLPIVHVFTSSTGLEPNKSYNRFSLYAALHHDGDSSEAAKALINLGYGDAGRRKQRWEKFDELYQFVNALAPESDDVPGDDECDDEADFQPPVMPKGEGDLISASKPLDIARQVVEKNWASQGMPIIFQRSKTWWIWNGRQYQQREDGDINSTLWHWLDKCQVKKKVEDEWKHVKFDPSRKVVNEVFDALKATTLIPEIVMPSYLGNDDMLKANRTIPLQNGLLDVSGTPKLVPHTPRWFSANCLPFAYNPRAKCPTWEWFVNDIQGGDEECVRYLQKWMAYNLIPDVRHQILTFLTGSGNNGKSTFLSVLLGLVGQGNYCTPSFADIAERFGRYQFLGKLAAIMPDAHMGRETDAIKCLEFMKAVSGGDPVNLEEKGKPMLTGVRLNTRFTLAVNEMPKLPDASKALGRRTRVIPFHQDYTGREDESLKEKLMGELPGIFNWALRGLQLLEADKGFNQPVAGKGILSEFLADSSPISEFVEIYCTIDPAMNVEKSLFRSSFSNWLMTTGHKSMADTTISKKLRAIDSKIDTDSKARILGKLTPVYKGIGLNADGVRLASQNVVYSSVA